MDGTGTDSNRTDGTETHETRTHKTETNTDPDPIVRVKNVALEFDEVSVLCDVSLDVAPGDFVGLVGPNGAGKTTLLRAISGALSPTKGRVIVDGKDVHALSSKESSRLLGVVPQDTTLSFSFDVRDVVEMGRHPHRSRFAPPTRRDRELVDRALERTRTTHLADRSIEAVSGGERQRVILARAIAQDTPVLLLDEPTASLDVSHQVETLDLVRSLVDDGRTVIAAIHDLDLAARFCDRLVVLADGEVHRSGPPADVLTPGTLASAFDATAAVTPNPVTGTPTVTTFAAGDGMVGERDGSVRAYPDRGNRDGPERSLSESGDWEVPDCTLPDRVHVIGAGTTAVGVFTRLDAAGIDVSIGPVPRGSVAAELAKTLGGDRIVLDPFEPVSTDERSAIDRRIRDAAVTVLAGEESVADAGAVMESIERIDRLVVMNDSAAGDRPLGDKLPAGRAERHGDAAAGSNTGDDAHEETNEELIRTVRDRGGRVAVTTPNSLLATLGTVNREVRDESRSSTADPTRADRRGSDLASSSSRIPHEPSSTAIESRPDGGSPEMDD